MLKTLLSPLGLKLAGVLVLALIAGLAVQTLRLSWAENAHLVTIGKLREVTSALDNLASVHKAGQERQKRELEAARRQSKADQPKIDRLIESAGKPDVTGPCEISETLKGSLPL